MYDSADLLVVLFTHQGSSCIFSTATDNRQAFYVSLLPSFFRRFGSVLKPEEVDNFYVATTESSGTGGANSSAVTSGPGLSPNRPHPERMPEGQPLTRALDPIDPAMVGALQIMSLFAQFNLLD